MDQKANDEPSNRAGSDAEEATQETDPVREPGSNPASHLMISDIVLRSIAELSRLSIEKLLLGRQYGAQIAKDAVENRSIVQTLAAYSVTKVATKSVPGAVAVSGALLLKVLFDRSQKRRKLRGSGRRTLRRQADRDSER